MNKAANKPAPCFLVIYVVSKYAAIELNDAKTGAKNTQIFLISIGIANLWSTIYINPDVD